MFDLSRLNSYQRYVGTQNEKTASSLDQSDSITFPASSIQRIAGWAKGLNIEHIRQHANVSPLDGVDRRATGWGGITAEFIETKENQKTEIRFRGPVHLLIVYEQGERSAGETFVEGLPTSTLRYFKRKLTFVPANRDYREWHEPRAKTRLIFFYFDPLMVQNFGMTSGEVEFRARMFFENTTLWEAASKLKRAAESTAAEDKRYVEVLADLLLCELVRFNRGTHNVARPMCGGLASRHQRIVADYIEGHLADRVPLRTLAQLVGLTPSHFCRAFKHSFGMPPHRYHVTRRIECAKRLLAKRDSSVTDIGLIMGFSEASSFTTAFRRITGLTPSAYSRGLA